MSLRNWLQPWFYPQEIQLSEQFNFGHREILVATNCLDHSTLFRTTLQHGWIEGKGSEKSLRNRMFQKIPQLVWSERIKNLLIHEGSNKVHVIGSPWSHLLNSCSIDPREIAKFNQSKVSNSAPKVLYIPSHSSHGLGFNYHLPSSELLSFTDATNITVCLFWLDYIDPEVRRFYSEFGFKLTCIGFRGSSGYEIPWAPIGGRLMFLPNLINLIERNDIVVVDELCTAFWYGLSLGKKAFISQGYELVNEWSHTGSKIRRYDRLKFMQNLEPRFAQIEIGEVMDPSEELLEIALSEIGWDSVDNLSKEFSRSKLATTVDFLSPGLITPISSFIQQKSQGEQLTDLS